MNITLILSYINTYIFGPALPLTLFAVGLFFLVRLNFFTLLHPCKIIRALTQKNSGDISYSPFKAVTVALAGTLGVGNIVGVATAITAGGAGAVFWMMLSAFVSMIIKYSEIVLAVCYRREDSHGKFGGAVYYILDGLHSKKLAALFSTLCILASFSLGSVIQISAAAETLKCTADISPVVVGIVCAAIGFAVIYGGLKRISDITVRMIPLLCGIYIIFSVAVIWMGRAYLGDVVRSIITQAFTFDGAAGGVGGFLLMRSLRYGVSRGVLSNEAGCGTAPTAHAGADTDSPAKQGCWGIFEVFADTILLCSLTAFVILIYTAQNPASVSCGGMVLALHAFEYYFGSAASIFLSISVSMFACATFICWSYYGIESVRYLSHGSERARKIFIILYCLSAVYAAYAESGFMWQLADFTIGAMTVINTVCICIMNKTVKKATDDYFKV